MKKYFIHDGTEQQGPFNLEDLKAIQIKRETPVWYEGLSDWTTADKIDELNDFFRSATPPPFLANQSAPPKFSRTKTEEYTFSSPLEKPRNFNFWKVIKIIVGLMLVLYVIYFINGQFNNGSSGLGESYLQKVMTVEEMEHATPVNFLTASGTYRQNIWGDKFKVKCVITNRATVATYKDAVVRITYYSKTRTELTSKDYTLYELFPPNTTKTIELKIDNYKDVSSLGWEVISARAY